MSPSATSDPAPYLPAQAALLASADCPSISRIFDAERRARLARSAQVLPVILTPENFADHRREAAAVEAIFATWGIPHELLTTENFPALRTLFYAGGTIKSFARPLLERGVQVVTAKSANAVCVAEFCLAQIILAAKGYFRNTRLCREPDTARSARACTGAGVYGEKIALLGMGAVARELVALLKPFHLQVLAVDPYLTPVEAERLGVTPATMEEAFSQAYVVSNHLPDLPALAGVLGRSLFTAMRPGGTFINTGRGAQVDEAGLIEIFQARSDLTALLDVTEPEPPLPGSPLYALPNVQLSSHIAGALNDDLQRLGDCLLEEFERSQAGKPLLHAEKLENLDRSA